jgi:geranylgeranyl reductase family protein
MTPASDLPTRTDVLVVGAGPAGAAAAAWMARFGHDVVLADAATFPRDKTCGDGLTPRAVAELDRLGLTDWLRGFGTNRGLRAAGFGQELLLPWPGGSLPDWGSAVPRTTLDARIRQAALDDGAVPLEGARAVDVVRDTDGSVTGVVFALGPDKTPHTIGCRRLIVADGVRSTLGRVLGREWHRDTAYGVAGRSYVKSERSDDPWISSHLELRGTANELLPGYGWIFPLSDGEVNLGVGALATAKRPADLQIRPLMEHYAQLRREEWGLGPDLRMPTSALLPMGGAVSGVAGPNWILIGDAAGCVNPLNGEGIDYGLETGRVGAELLEEATKVSLDVERAWPSLLTSHYGEAFSIARRIAGVFTIPGLLPKAGPIGMRSHGLMTVALRVMGNFITDDDRDATARLWRWAGRRSVKLDTRPPWS